MLTYEQIAEGVSHITYKPGWRLGTYLSPWGGPYLEITAAVHDTGWATVKAVSQIPPMETPHHLDLWLQWRIIQVEINECMGCLCRNGIPLFNRDLQ